MLFRGGNPGSAGKLNLGDADLVSRPVSSQHISKARSAQALGGRAQD